MKKRIIKEWSPESEGSTPDGMTDKECRYIDTEIDATTRQVIAVIFDDYDEEEEIARSEPVEYKSSLSPKMARLAYNEACNDAKLKLNESIYRRKEYRMKITKRQLRRIIRETSRKLASESCGSIANDQAVHSSSGRNLDYGRGEGKMTRSQLYHVAEYSSQLHDIIRDDDDLPEWVQSKIAVMASDIGKIKHYLEYKLMRIKDSV